MAIDKITLDATKCILAARLRGCNAPFWRIQCGVSFPTEPVTIPILSSFRRRPESRTHAYYSNSRPEQCCTSGASSHAALGTGLRRYDGLDGWCLFAVALPA